jgi:branched-chain amino acid transport system substrate-binding protein
MVKSDKPTQRRSFLKAAGTTGLATMAGLAGCSGDGGDGGGDGGDGGGGDGGDGGGGSTGTPSEDPVLVGGIVPLSGPLGQLGQSEQQGIEAAVQYVNDEMGGMAGRDVEVVFEDTATSTETGRERARKLVEEDDVDLLAGAVSGAVAGTIADYAAGPGVPFWTYGGSASITGADCQPTTFRYTTHTVQDAMAGAPWALENLGSNVWIHYADYSYGQAINDDWQAAMESASVDANVVNVTNTQLGTSDYSSYISQMQASDADWVLAAVTGADLISFVQQADQFGLKQEKDLVSQNLTIPIRGAVGSAGVGWYGNIRYDLDGESEQNQALKDTFSSMFDGVPTDPAAVMWASLVLHTKGANAAGSVATEDVVPELEGLQSDSPAGQTTVRACDHQCIRDVPMGRVTAPDQYDWPGFETVATRAGDELLPSCDELGCDMPSL